MTKKKEEHLFVESFSTNTFQLFQINSFYGRCIHVRWTFSQSEHNTQTSEFFGGRQEFIFQPLGCQFENDPPPGIECLAASLPRGVVLYKASTQLQNSFPHHDAATTIPQSGGMVVAATIPPPMRPISANWSHLSR